MERLRGKACHILVSVMTVLSMFISVAWGADRGQIGSGETNTGYLQASDDYEDSWNFYGDAGDQVVITASRINGGVEPQILLYPPDNSGLEASATGSADNKTLDHQLQQTGLYTIIINDYGMNEAGDYGISLAKIPGAATSPSDPNGGAIASGETLSGGLTPLADTDIYQFYGDAGDQVIITASRINGGVDPQIFLYPPDNSGLEASATGSADNKTLDHQLQQTGLYTIIINDYGMNEAGDYGISLAKIPGAATSPSDPNGGAIASGETLSGGLTPLADTDIYQFYGDAGDQVIITASRINGGVDPQIFLYPPDNSGLEASATGSADNKTLDHQLQQTGLYTIIINDYGMNEAGDYGISLAKIPGAATSPSDPNGGAIASGETLSGGLTPLADTDIYQFYGDAGDQVIITASRINGGVDPQIFLYPPDNSGLEASATGSADNKTLDHQLQQTGLYTIIINDYGMNEAGEFNISFSKSPPGGLGIYNPSPRSGSTVDDATGNFTWDAVPGATGYDLYFGENVTIPVELIGEDLPTPFLPLPDLLPHTVYYWYVVAHTSDGDIRGPVWWFKKSDFSCLGDPPCFGDFDVDSDVDGTDLSDLAGALLNFDSTTDLAALFANGFGRSDCPQITYKMNGLNFSPYKDGQDPNLGSIISEEQIRERMLIIAPFTEWVRSFGTTDGLEQIGAVAQDFGLKTAVGAWLSDDLQANTQQMNNLIEAAQNGHVDLAIVGSEVLLRNDLTASQLIAYITQFKSAVPNVAVTTADVYSALLSNPDVMAACDVILVNYYPFWECLPIDHAIARIHDLHQQVVTAAGGKTVIVSETGWPSQGEPCCGAVPSLGNASDYLTNFVSWARAEDVEYFYFEAFDESWKAAYEGEVGAHWGIWDKNGDMKACMEPVFYDITVADNWSCQAVPGGPGDPDIQFTYVPAYGSNCNLFGSVRHVRPEDHKVAVYIRVGSGWWTKPYWNDPVTPIDCHGFWSCDITTGGSDPLANTIAAFLIPVGYDPPLASGQTSLPAELYENAASYVEVIRSP